jgi:DNA-binding HxlR family transcriptional regulator
MTGNEKKILQRAAPREVGRMVETVIGCKWSLTVLNLLRRGIARPGEMERSVEGLSAKVLNSCLRRLVEFKVLEKWSYAEVPPRVEYRLTEFGAKFQKALDVLDALELDFMMMKANAERPEPIATTPRSRIANRHEDSAASLKSLPLSS